MFDVVIVGGGPAGLSAALALGRCRRRVLICDSGHPRNAASKALHGYLTRDGIDPIEFIHIGRHELRRYPNVDFLQAEIVSVQRREGRFVIATRGGETFVGRLLFLATGMVDPLPPLPGIEAFYGKSVHHCPYCDGWEHNDQPLAVYGMGREVVDLALKLRAWSADVTITPSDGTLSLADLQMLRGTGVRIKLGKITRLEGSGGWLSGLKFEDDSELPAQALFFVPKPHPRSGLAQSLGCRMSSSGQIECGPNQETSVEGVFAMGNVAEGLQLVIIAVAEGAKAAFAIDEALYRAAAMDSGGRSA